MQARPSALRSSWLHHVRHALLITLAATVAMVATLRWSAHISQFIFVWPVTGILMAMILPRWAGSLRSRFLLLTAAGLGVLLGGFAVGMPGWLALQTTALSFVDLSLTTILLVPTVNSFAMLKHRRGVVRFALTAILVPLCTAMMGAPSLSGFLHQPALRTGIESFFANSLGIALLYSAGLFLTTASPGRVRALSNQRQVWLSLIFFTAIACGAFAQNEGPFLFVVFPPMIVVLMVLGLEGAVIVSLLLSAIGWFATMHGHGPIMLLRTATPEYRLFILQVFVWTCLATAMPVGALLDERREAEHKAEEARGIYQTMLHNAEEMIVLSSMNNDQRYVSPSVERLTGWTPEEYLGMDRMATFHPDDRDIAGTLLQSLSAGKWEHTMRYRAMQKAGGYRWLEATVRAYGDRTAGEVKGYVAAIRDISEQRKTEHEWAEERAALTLEQTRLNSLATTDALTGLPNRRAFEDLLASHEFDMRKQAEHVLTVNRAYTIGLRKLTVMMVDVDFFKLYNDTYGHAEGDSCLRALADILRSTLSRKDDIVARLGGEEFAIVLPGAGTTAAMRVAQRLVEAVRHAQRPHSASPLGHVTVSIGVAVGMPSTDFNYALLLQQADRALYQCKSIGKNCALPSVSRQ